MSNLISRKIVMDWLRDLQAQAIINEHNGTLVDATINATVMEFINFIVTMPTAYDVDKVISQLSNKMFSAECYNDDFNGCEINNLLCMGDVYEIVKGGEIDG